MACFSSPKNGRQPTSFTSNPPQISPAKNHVLHTRFCQNHQQKRVKTAPEKITAKAFPLPVGSWLLQADDDGSGHFVLVFEIEQLDPLGAAAGGADGFRVDADDLAELADDISSLVSSTRLILDTLPTFGVAFMLMTPCRRATADGTDPHPSACHTRSPRPKRIRQGVSPSCLSASPASPQ